MKVFEEVADKRFRYVTPPSDFAMHDNWEYASTFARGEYVTILIDKTCLRPSALQVMHDTLEKYSADIMSWWNEAYLVTDEIAGYEEGTYSPIYDRILSPRYFNTMEELQRRFNIDVRRGTEGVRYCWGKICFGAYHKNLIQKIRNRIGRLFYPISPDYTSMVAALAYANKAVDLGEPLLISFITKLSTGYNNDLSIENLVTFLRTMDADLKILGDLPLKNLYASSHNIIAYDCSEMKKRIGKTLGHINLNIRNLLLRAKEDLDKRQWKEQEGVCKKEQYALWKSHFAQLSFPERLRVISQVHKGEGEELLAIVKGALREKLKMAPHLSRALRTMLRRPTNTSIKTQRFSSIINALSFADEYYGRLKSVAEKEKNLSKI
jgi:hypothetical protein